MGSQPAGPALVAAAADADPVTLLVTAWLSVRRPVNTRVGSIPGGTCRVRVPGRRVSSG